MKRVSLKNGTICCSGDAKYFCDHCKGQLLRTQTRMPSEPQWRAYLTTGLSDWVPPPVGLVTTVQQQRDEAPSTREQRVARFFGGPRPLAPSTRPLTVATRSAVPPPLGLVATIQQKGKTR